MSIRSFFATTFAAAIILFNAGCKENSNTGHFQARMIDVPVAGNVQEINVHLIGAEAYIVGTGWTNLPISGGVYNLLKLANGMDTLFVNTQIPTGKLTQFRLKLGKNNTIKVDNMLHPLNLPAKAEPGLKVSVNEEISDAETTVLFLDFDAVQSVSLNANGDYILHPVMRGFNATQTGAITGNYTATYESITVEAQTGVRVFTTYAEKHSGHFMLRGLPPGSYTLRIYTAESAAPLSVTVVSVAANAIVDLGVL
ncbi:MAG: DUF4382 domain-containing protein [Bacteroidia bacterium]